MSPVRKQLDVMIDSLTEQDQALLLKIVERLIPDDVATPEDLEAIREAREEYARGETVSHESINWN